MLAENTGDRNIYFKAMIDDILFLFMINTGLFEPDHDWSVEKHNNSAYELHFFLDGEGILSVEDKKFRMKKGDFCLIRPGIYHAQQKTDGTMLRKCIISFTFKPQASARREDLTQAGKEEGRRIVKALENITYVKAHDETGMEGLLSELSGVLQEKPLGYNAGVRSLLTLLLMKLFKELPAQEKGEEQKAEISAQDADSEAIDVFFYQHYAQDIHAEDLARERNVSERQLNRILKRLYQKTFKQMLIETRMIHAMEYLKATDLPVSVVAEKTGYNDIKYFSKLFVSKTGLTPAQYREAEAREKT